MFRLWGKLWKDNHMLKDLVIDDDSEDTRTHKIFRALQEFAAARTCPFLSNTATLQALVPISIPSKYDFVISAAPISPLPVNSSDSFYKLLPHSGSLFQLLLFTPFTAAFRSESLRIFPQ